MTLAGWIATLSYGLLAAGLGGMVTRLFRFSESRLVNSWAAYYLSGQILITIVTISTAFLPVALSTMLCLAAVVSVLYWGNVLRQYRLAGYRRFALSLGQVLGFLVVLALLFPGLILTIQKVPLWDWDARSNWFFHGKAIFLAGGVDASFFTNCLYEWSHHDYPLLIPAQAAWNAILGGGWSEYSVKAFLWLNFAAYVSLFLQIMRARGYAWWLALFLAVIVFDRESYSYVSGSADNHYIIAIFLALLALAVAPSSDRWPAAILLLSFAAIVKNEGTSYVVVMACGAILVAFARACIMHVRGLAGWRIGFKPVMWALLLWILPTVMWLCFRAFNQIPNDLALGSRLSQMGLMTQLLGERWRQIVGFGWDFYLSKGGLFLVALIAVLAAWRWLLAKRRAKHSSWYSPAEWLLVAFFLTVNVLIFVVYVATPLDITFHLSTSGTRLLFFPYMLLVLLCLLGVDGLRDLLNDRGGEVEGEDRVTRVPAGQRT